MSPLVDDFLRQRTVKAPGCRVALGDLYAAFFQWLPEADRPKWSRRLFSREIDLRQMVRGRSTNGLNAIGNLMLPRYRYVRNGASISRQPICA